MRIAFDAMAARQSDRMSSRLAEPVPAVDGHGNHRALRGGVLLFGMSDF
jgi:hypothetical protein